MTAIGTGDASAGIVNVSSSLGPYIPSGARVYFLDAGGHCNDSGASMIQCRICNADWELFATEQPVYTGLGNGSYRAVGGDYYAALDTRLMQDPVPLGRGLTTSPSFHMSNTGPNVDTKLYEFTARFLIKTPYERSKWERAE